MSRIGHGYDVHRFADDRLLILGGVEIPFEQGLLGHSDADVLTHAVIDALLGAAALGDIGQHFPDSKEEFRGISSLILLGKVRSLLDKNGYKVGNIDVTLVAQRPKISQFKEHMRKNIADTLGCEADRVNIKGKTEEGLGFTGEMLGIACHAVALIEKT